MNQLKNGALSALAKELDLKPITDYQYCYAIEVKQLNQDIDKLIVHYDILSRYSNDNGFDNLHDLMTNATDIKIITVCATEDTLVKRANLSVYKLLEQLSKERRNIHYEQLLPLINKLKNRITIHTICNKPENIHQLYENWFASFKQYHSYEHWLVDSQKPNQPVKCPESMGEIWSFIKETTRQK